MPHFSDKLKSAVHKINGTSEHNVVCCHNLSTTNLAFTVDFFSGYLICPSIGFTSTEVGMGEYGEITIFAGDALTEEAIKECYSSDIYTPRSPEFKFKIKKQPLKKIIDDINEVAKGITSPSAEIKIDESSIQHSLQNGLRHFTLHTSYDEIALKYAFAYSKGQQPTLKTEINLDPVLHPLLETEVLNYVIQGDLDINEKNESPIKDSLIAKRDEYKVNNPKRRRSPFCKFLKSRQGEITIDKDLIEIGMFALQEYNKDRTSPDIHLLSSELTEVCRAHGSEYEQWIESTFTAVLGELHFRKYDDIGEYEDIPATRKAVVVDYISRKSVGESYNFGIGEVRASHTVKLDTKDAIIRNMHKIVGQKKMAAAKDDIELLICDFESKLQDAFKYDGDFHFARRAICQGLANCTTEDLSGLNEDFNMDDISQKTRTSIKHCLEKITFCEAPYFEAKIYDEVNLNKFKAALIPDDSPQTTTDRLKRHGIYEIHTYKANDEADRLKQFQKISEQGHHLKPESAPELVKSAMKPFV